MKMLSIRQPWASLICAGIKDVENRTWNAKHRGRMLIHASSAKCPKDIAYLLPVEMGNAMRNEHIYGNLDLNDFPTGAIIGYVDLVDCVEDDVDSIWADPGCVKFILKNAYMFDEPIVGVKGKLNIFEYDMDENNLPPAHKAEPRRPRAEGDELIMPLSKEYFDRETADENLNQLGLYVSEEMMDTFFVREDGKLEWSSKLDDVTKITLTAPDGRKATYGLDGMDVLSMKDDDGNEVKAPSIYGDETCIWLLDMQLTKL